MLFILLEYSNIGRLFLRTENFIIGGAEGILYGGKLAGIDMLDTSFYFNEGFAGHINSAKLKIADKFCLADFFAFTDAANIFAYMDAVILFYFLFFHAHSPLINMD